MDLKQLSEQILNDKFIAALPQLHAIKKEAESGNLSNVEPLLEVFFDRLLTSGSDQLRGSVGMILGRAAAHNSRIADRLANFLTASETQERVEAVHAMSHMWDAGEEFGPCVLPLIGDSELAVRWRAAQCLGRIGCQAARAELQKITGDVSTVDFDDRTLGKIAENAILELDAANE